MRKVIVNRDLQVLDNMRPEDLAQPLYDRGHLATTVPSTLSLFSIPIGQSATLIRQSTAAAVTKTRRDTNMEQAGFIATRAYQINGLAIAIVHLTREAATNAIDREYIRDGGWLRFTVAAKTILEIPLLQIPLMNDQVAASTTATNTTINAYAGPKASMWRFNPAVTMKATTNFNVELSFDGTITLNNEADIQLFMFAGMRRPT